uniref:Uncharacterized protein n=4 Tax=Ciona intestinalis TaxID=7719 RepID=F6VEC1_CIOIN
AERNNLPKLSDSNIKTQLSEFFNLAIPEQLVSVPPTKAEAQYFQLGVSPKVILHFRLTYPVDQDIEPILIKLRKWPLLSWQPTTVSIVNKSLIDLGPHLTRDFIGEVDVINPADNSLTTAQDSEYFVDLFTSAINVNETKVTASFSKFETLYNSTVRAKVWISSLPGFDLTPRSLTNDVRIFRETHPRYLLNKTSLIVKPRPPPEVMTPPQDKILVGYVVLKEAVISDVIDLYPTIDELVFNTYSQKVMNWIATSLENKTYQHVVEYFQHLPNQSLLAHVKLTQPHDDNTTAAQIEKMLNLNTTNNIESFKLGEPRTFVGSLDFFMNTSVTTNKTQNDLVDLLDSILPGTLHFVKMERTINNSMRINFTLTSNPNVPSLAHNLQRDGRKELK